MTGDRTSCLGSYAGYSSPVADGYVRTSEYVTVRDGCRLAIDVLHPARDGVPLGGRRPVVVRGTGYRRAFRRTERIAYDVSRIPIIQRYPVGAVITPYELAPAAQRLVDHGYVFVSVDLRGTGASFGDYDHPVTLQTGRDLADAVDWIAVQNWSDGKIGMWGRSWEAACQLVTAVAGTRNLTCLLPMGTGLHFESTWYSGLLAIGFKWPYHEMRKRMELDDGAMPVDGPDGERLRAEACTNRKADFPWPSQDALVAANRDGLFAEAWLERSLAIGAPVDPALGRPRTSIEDADAINACGLPIYWVEGWWDLNFINTALGLYNALDVPKKLTVGPWTHSQFAMAHEPQRWFDHWLRGIENGIMDEAEVQYAVAAMNGSTTWHAAPGLPLPGTVETTYFLGQADAAGNGALMTAAPAQGTTRHRSDPNVSTGPQTRTSYLWRSTAMNYGDLSRRLGHCLAFTTPPLQLDIDLVGAPCLFLPLQVDQPAAAIFATLEDVHSDGTSRYLTEGALNLAHRAELDRPPHHVGHVKHPWFGSQQQTVPVNERMLVTVDMLAVACRIPAGHALRVTLACADRDNYVAPSDDRPVTLDLANGSDGARLYLPVVPAGQIPPAMTGVFQHDPMPFGFELQDEAHA